MRPVFPDRLPMVFLLDNERGIVLVVTLVVMVLLMGMGSISLFSGYTHLVTSTNLKFTTRARATAEAAVNEALYRLSRQETQPEAIALDLTDPNWQVEIMPDGSSNPPAQVATIQDASDWPYAADTPPVMLQYKRNPPSSNNIVFYDRTRTPPFITIALPGAVPNTAHPVIQILATGLDERDAEQQVLAETAASTLFSAPPAPLATGASINLNGSGFIDGVNHDHRIYISPGGGSTAIFGDGANSETTDAHPGGQVKDSPDDNVAAGGGCNTGVGNPSLNIPVPAPAYSSCARLFNRQAGANLPLSGIPAWVGLGWTTVGDGHSADPHWHGVNTGYTSAIALSSTPVVLNDQPPTGNVYTRGVFTWRVNNGTTSLSGTTPAPGTMAPCELATPTLVCRPAELATFPTFQEFLGLDDVAFQKLLDQPDTTAADLNNGQPPLGFTYVQGDYTFNNSTASPGTGDFGLLYVTGNLRITGNNTFKGLIYVRGSLSVSGNPTILGTIMVKGSTAITVSTGNMTLLYSRKAAELGAQTAHAWRVLSWKDTAMQ